MGSRLMVFLTREQDRILFNLRTAEVPQKVQDRAEVIRLSADGWYVEKIATHFHWTAQTVREVLHKWQKLGVEGLGSKPGRGGEQKWTEADMVFLEKCLEKEPRTYMKEPFYRSQPKISATCCQTVIGSKGLVMIPATSRAVNRWRSRDRTLAVNKITGMF
ncbi:transposase [Stanieria sp. NIES-3757]|nr:transposase [Stanieria sp. NIES-3757]